MSDITFEEENALKNAQFQSRTILGQPETPKMISFLINKGIVKNQKTAGIMLVCMSIIFLLLAVYIFLTFVLDVQFFKGSNERPVGVPLQQRLNR